MPMASNMSYCRRGDIPHCATNRAIGSSPMRCRRGGGFMETVEDNVPETRKAGAPPTLRAHVVRLISAQILEGRYKPGDRLNESQIARELNISRIPVREALSQLQEQGLVQNRERRGMFVTNIGPEEVRQISSLRIILET